MGTGKGNGKVEELLYEIENIVERLIVQKDKEKEGLMEELLVGMLGHPVDSVREKSVVLLNGLQDEVDWQVKYSMNPKVREVGDVFWVEYLISQEEVSSVE